jgi:hypothetical protein
MRFFGFKNNNDVAEVVTSEARLIKKIGDWEKRFSEGIKR